jgi:hypothetical protein
VDRGRLHHLGLVEVRGQPGNEVQAGGDAGGTQFGEALSESGDESVAPASGSHTGVGGLTLCSGACAAAAATSGSSPISGWPELALSAPREATFTATITGDRLELGYVWVGDPVCGARLLPALRALGRPVAEQVTMPSYLELQRRDDSDEGHAQRRYW